MDRSGSNVQPVDKDYTGRNVFSDASSLVEKWNFSGNILILSLGVKRGGKKTRFICLRTFIN